MPLDVLCRTRATVRAIGYIALAEYLTLWKEGSIQLH